MAKSNAPKRSWIWVFFAAACLLQLAAWAAWLTVASKHRVAEVPVVTNPRR